MDYIKRKISLLFHPWFWTDMYYDIKWGIIALWRHRKVIWKYRDWDSGYILETLQLQLTLLVDRLEKHGYEVEETRNPKIEDIKRCIEILKNIREDNYLERVGGAHFLEYPFKLEPNTDPNRPNTFVQVEFRTPEEIKHDREQLKASFTLMELEWNELWNTIKRGNKASGGLNTWWD